MTGIRGAAPLKVFLTPSKMKLAASALDTPGKPGAPSSRPVTGNSPACSCSAHITTSMKPSTITVVIPESIVLQLWLVHVRGMDHLLT